MRSKNLRTTTNETYAHLNVNYLQMNQLPTYSQGWQPVLDVMKQGKCFVSTGEVLFPAFSVNGKGAGETVKLPEDGKTALLLNVDWTFPLTFAEIVSGDGKAVFRERIDLTKTLPFGKQKFTFNTNLKGKKWVRVEVWDAAVDTVEDPDSGRSVDRLSVQHWVNYSEQTLYI